MAVRKPRKTTKQKREEQEILETQTANDDGEEEVIHGDLVISDDGSVDVVSPVDPSKQLSVKEKQRIAMNLKMMGASYQSIADNVGYADASGAYRAVQSGMKEALKDSAVDLRNMTYMQLQQLFMVWWPKALKGDAQATAICMQISDRITSLFGLSGMPVEEESTDQGVLVVGGSGDQYADALRKARKGNQQT
jgi:hypothetical protein